MCSVIEIVLKLVHEYVYTKEAFFVYRKCNQVNLESPALIKRVDNRNVRDVLSFNDKAYLKTFIDFMTKGDIGYYAYLNGECVHRSWVKKGPQDIRFMRKYILSLTKDDLYVHYCATAERARGKNIYPAVLLHICEEFKNMNVYALVLERKHFACRGVEKAGFKKVKRVILRRIFCFAIIQEAILTHTL